MNATEGTQKTPHRTHACAHFSRCVSHFAQATQCTCNGSRYLSDSVCLSKIVPSAHHVTPGCSRVLGFPSCLVFVYKAEDTADRDQTKPVRDPALGWTVWPSGQSDSKHITQQAWLSEHQCLKQQDSFPLQWPVVQIQRHTRPRRGCRDAVPPPHPGGRSLAGGATRTQNYLSNLCDAHTLDTLMEQATEGDWISLDLHHVPGDGAWRTQLATL